MNDLEELGGKEFLVLTGQYSVEIFSFCLRFLPSYSSTHHTTIESTQIYSEDHLSSLQNSIVPSSSRSNSPCRRRVFSLFAHWVRLIELSSWFNINPCSFLEKVQSLKMDGLLGFALALDRLAHANTLVFNANTSVLVSEVSCSLSSYSLSIKSVTNLFNP